MSLVTQPSKLRMTARRCLNVVLAQAFWALSAARTLSLMVAAESAGRAGTERDEGRELDIQRSLRTSRVPGKAQELASFDLLAMCMFDAGSKQVMNLSRFAAPCGTSDGSDRCELMDGDTSFLPTQPGSLSCRGEVVERQTISSILDGVSFPSDVAAYLWEGARERASFAALVPAVARVRVADSETRYARGNLLDRVVGRIVVGSVDDHAGRSASRRSRRWRAVVCGQQGGRPDASSTSNDSSLRAWADLTRHLIRS